MKHNAGRLIRASTDWVRAHSTAVGAGLLAVVLVATGITILVLVRNIGDQLATATVTPSPSGLSTPGPTGQASETSAPSPIAAPSLGATWHGYDLTEVVTPVVGGLWGHVVVDRLNVREAAGTGAGVVGVALRGDMLVVSGDTEYIDGQEWAPVVGNGLAGWISTADGTTTYFSPVATPWLFGSQRLLNGLAVSGDQLLAYGGAQDLSTLPYEGSGWRAMVYSSEDGVTWRQAADLCCGPATAATGGGGNFVLAITPSYIEPNHVQLSGDGLAWSEPSVLSISAESAAWGPAGAVLVGGAWDSDVIATRVRADGSVEPLTLSSSDGMVPARVQASSAGYVAFDPSAATLWVSADAVAWTQQAVPGTDANAASVRDVELDGSRLIVVLVDKESGATSLRLGQLQATGQVDWDSQQLTPFGSATVDSVTLGGGAFLAIGWDRQQLVPHVWRSPDGRAWTDLAVDPGTFGGAIGPAPVFAGGRWYAATDAIYGSNDGATWQEVFRPPVVPTEHPGCPPAEDVTALDLLFLGDLAADCYGNEPLNVTGWITVPDGLGGCCWPTGEPGWLNGNIPSGFLGLANPGGSFDFTRSFGVYPVPDLAGEFGTEGWARVTGHFHDPASQECRSTPLTWHPLHRLEALSAVIAGCEQRFVVDSVTRYEP